MAIKTFGVKDAYALMDTLVHQAVGTADITVTDTSSFVDAGTMVLEAGYENLFNALGVLIGQTVIASRPYTGKFGLIAAPSGSVFDARMRKISYYARDNQASGMYNTNLNTNLGEGLGDEDGVGSMWEQNPAIPVEKYFYSQFAWDKSTTEYPEQVKYAFTNEADFVKFVNGMMVEVMNDIESTLEAKNRLVVIDRIAGQYLQAKGEDPVLGAECAVNCTAEFNEENGTQYTTAEILSEHRVEFLEWFIAKFKIVSDRLESRTAHFHDPMTKVVNEGEADEKTYKVLRHTPKSAQKFIYYAPIFNKLKMVFAEIFNPQYLDLPNGEGIDFWQSFDSPSEIDVIPALPEGAESSEVHLKLVLGMLFDSDACMTRNNFTGMYTTPIHPRKVYQNLFWHYNYSVYQDYSENAVIFYMADPEDEPTIETFTGDGTEDDFTLEGTATKIVYVTVNGEKKTATTDYTFADNTVTFTVAPANKAVIKIAYV